MKLKAYMVIVIALFAYSQVKGQVYNDLDEKTNKLIAQRAQEEVGQFTQYLQDIADKSISLKSRYKYKDIALTLFIGGGNEYYDEILDDNNNIIDKKRHEPVKMWITSVNSSRKTKRYMKDYLKALAELKYKSVTISSTEWHDMKVSSIQKIGEGKYVCTVYFEQVFVGRGGDNQILYTDKTRKRVTCFVEVVRTDDGIEILVLLGDVEAGKTTKN